MSIKFLGTGGAFDFEIGNSAAWVNIRGKNILLDCGNSTYRKLRETGLANQFDYILITHCHDDHVGSLATVILHHSYFIQPARKVNILCPTPSFQEHLFQYICYAIPSAHKYVNFIPLSEFEGIDAIDTSGLHVPEMPSFGYIFEFEDGIIAYSGDLGDPDVIFEYLKDKKYDNKSVKVFHDVSYDKGDGVHVYYKDLIPWLEEFEIIGYHHDHTQNPLDNPIPQVADFPELLC